MDNFSRQQQQQQQFLQQQQQLELEQQMQQQQQPNSMLIFSQASTSGASSRGQSNPASAEKRFPCPNCPSIFNHKKNLNRHIAYECCLEPRFKCPYCESMSKRPSTVYYHVRNRHEAQKVYCIDLTALPPRVKFPSTSAFHQ